ncbi:MAG: hypothetical protein ACRDHY_11535, partial [Anaerolineales bacterium]
MLTAASLDPAAIAVDSPGPVLAFAAEELRSHLPPGSRQRDVAVRISSGDGDVDGFVVSVHDGDVAIRGGNPRGALNGAYWLLEQLGYAWVEPGDRGTRFVAGKSLAAGEYHETPAFPLRTLILGQDALHDDWPGWLEWASRNRYNDIFFHDT